MIMGPLVSNLEDLILLLKEGINWEKTIEHTFVALEKIRAIIKYQEKKNVFKIEEGS